MVSALHTWKVKEQMQSHPDFSEHDQKYFVLPVGHLLHLSRFPEIFAPDSLEKHSRDGPHTLPILKWFFKAPAPQTSVGFYMPFAHCSFETMLSSGDQAERIQFLELSWLCWLPQLVNAVHLLHQKYEISHNDLQLRNIMWDAKKQQVSLLDWELASIHRKEKKEASTLRYDQRTGNMTLIRFMEIASTFWMDIQEQYRRDWRYVITIVETILKLFELYRCGGKIKKNLVNFVQHLKQLLSVSTWTSSIEEQVFSYFLK